VDSARFSRRLLQWFARHGRKDLPWQCDPTPYRVWVSEVMLQQTQVATVIPYFDQFMSRFPDVRSLAAASLDEVLHHWTGLGYYARARHLHRAAGTVVAQYAGELPDDLQALQALPGIGRSTAAAILALSRGQPHAILDGNVKRVLCRYHGIEGWPGRSDIERRLWELAQTHTPPRRAAAYTQAIMDLGATVCTRAAPRCGLCPLRGDCTAHLGGTPGDFPSPRPGKQLPVRSARFMILCNPHGEVLLTQRPPAGVWGGLWSFPECPADEAAQQWCEGALNCRISGIEEWPAFRHTFSHFHLDITPVYARVDGVRQPRIMEGRKCVWYNLLRPGALGVATPVKRLLNQLSQYLS
jgi:A/G-specific adenine glycosylase